MKRREKILLDLINTSGYLFQLAVAREITDSSSLTKWKIASQEHPWRDEATGEDGFIDLILEHTGYIARMVIECKRVDGATWAFLQPEASHAEVTWLRCHWIDCIPDERRLSAWDDIHVDPASGESEFCVIRGSSDRHSSFLERLTRPLLRSTEIVASEEVGFIYGADIAGTLVHIPVIVTTAELVSCRFDTNDIDLEGGTLLEGHASFETVPFIRFRKSLATSDPRASSCSVLEQARRANERTVFVVNAGHLVEFLSVFAMRKPDFYGYPWHRARAARSS